MLCNSLPGFIFQNPSRVEQIGGVILDRHFVLRMVLVFINPTNTMISSPTRLPLTLGLYKFFQQSKSFLSKSYLIHIMYFCATIGWIMTWTNHIMGSVHNSAYLLYPPRIRKFAAPFYHEEVKKTLHRGCMFIQHSVIYLFVCFVLARCNLLPGNLPHELLLLVCTYM